MAEHDRYGEGDDPVDDGQVAVAQPGRVDADQHLARARVPDLQVVDDRGLRPVEDHASHHHTTAWSSLYACSPKEPPSRPIPLCLKPPKGVSG